MKRAGRQILCFCIKILRMPNIAIQHWTFQVEIALGKGNFVKIKHEYFINFTEINLKLLTPLRLE